LAFGFLLGSFFLLAAASEAEAENLDELFFEANKAYEEERFQEAVEAYNTIAAYGLQNGHVYYNLGNAHYRLGYIGKAILNFERARLLIPRDPDLKFNLNHARDQTQDALPEPKGFIRTTFFWLGSLTLGEAFWAFALLNLVFWTFLFIRLLRRSEWTYYLTLILLILWLIAGTSFALKYYRLKTDDRAVVLPKEARVLAGPHEQDTLLFKLHEGAVVHVERSEVGWALIHLPDGKRGWIKVEAVEKIQRG
jgi:tetratricopeptide (TPR) repeat protein